MPGRSSFVCGRMVNVSDLHEITVRSEPAYLGHLVKVYVETVQLPNGTQAVREIVRHPGAVAMVPLLSNGDVLLVRQYRHAAGDLLLEIPAGTLEAGEAPGAGCCTRIAGGDRLFAGQAGAADR